MPIKVTDVLQNFNDEYPVVAVSDNSIAGIHSISSLTTGNLQSISDYKREVGSLLRANNKYYVYKGADVTALNWDLVSSYDEVATAFHNYDDLGVDHNAIIEAMVDFVEDEFYLAGYHKADQQFYRIDWSYITEYLLQSLIDANIEAGIGTIETYTGQGLGIIGDLNDDGSVSTADLLIFLSYFQTSTEFYDNAVVVFDGSLSQELLDSSQSGTYNYTNVGYPWQISDVSVTAGGWAVTLAANNYIEFTGTAVQNAASSLAALANLVTFHCTNISFEIEAADDDYFTAGFIVYQYDSSNQLIGSLLTVPFFTAYPVTSTTTTFNVPNINVNAWTLSQTGTPLLSGYVTKLRFNPYVHCTGGNVTVHDFNFTLTLES